MVGKRCDPAVLTQILHFTDFNFSKRVYDLWAGKTFDEWVRDSRKKIGEKEIEYSKNPAYSPFIFVDSGGFKLLSETSYDLKEFGIEENPESIYELQKTFDSDAIMSLDYPFPRNLVDEEKEERIQKSIKNAIRCLELWKDDNRKTKPIPYLAVHGHGFEETNKYVSDLFSEIKSKGLDDIQFGLAIGSLVRIAGNFKLVSDCILGVKAAIKDNNSSFPEIPIHVFGLSGYIAPFLMYLGVDTFDSNNYVQSATNLGFLIDNKKHRNKKFYDLDKKDCRGTKYAKILHDNFKPAKDVLKAKPNKYHDFNGEEVPKSKVYSLIALHNLEVIQKEINHFLESEKRGNSVSHIVEYGLRTDRGKNLLRHLMEKEECIELKEYIESNNIDLPVKKAVPEKKMRLISMKLGPDDFNINKMRYKPKKKPVMLLLPCSGEKPYSKSRTHKAVYTELKKTGIDAEQIQKVTISGNYGPVPEEFEDEKQIMQYEYMLNPNSTDRIELIVDRTVEFLKKHGGKYEMIVGYATSKAYRTVIERALKEYGKGEVEPKDLRTKRGVEMGRKTNLKQLSDVIGEKIAKYTQTRLQ